MMINHISAIDIRKFDFDFLRVHTVAESGINKFLSEIKSTSCDEVVIFDIKPSSKPDHVLIMWSFVRPLIPDQP